MRKETWTRVVSILWPTQPFPFRIVYTNVIGQTAKLISGLLLTATLLIGLQHVNTPDVQRFLKYYQAAEKTDTSINFFERVAFSFVLTRTNQ